MDVAPKDTHIIRYAIRISEPQKDGTWETGWASQSPYDNGPNEFSFARLYHKYGDAEMRAKRIVRASGSFGRKVVNGLPPNKAEVVAIRITHREFS